MSRYIFSPEAKQDLREIRDYITQNNPTAARSFIESIRKKCQYLARFPNLGRSYNELSPELRGFPIRRYIVLYRPIQDGVEIIRVVSGYRNLEGIFSDEEDS